MQRIHFKTNDVTFYEVTDWLEQRYAVFQIMYNQSIWVYNMMEYVWDITVVDTEHMVELMLRFPVRTGISNEYQNYKNEQAKLKM
jgi:hypothetical protein